MRRCGDVAPPPFCAEDAEGDCESEAELDADPDMAGMFGVYGLRHRLER